MLQPHEFLQPLLYRSGFTDSHYNPRLLLTRVIAGAFESGDDPTFMPRTFEYNATVVHERVHWLQHLGTSFGALLESIRFSQQGTTLRWLRDVPNHEIVHLLDTRNNGVEPILPLMSETLYPKFDASGDENPLNLFRQIWFDHQWIHSILEDSRTSEQTLGRPPNHVVGEIFGDVMLALTSEAGFKSEHYENRSDPYEPRSWFTPDLPITFVRIGDMRLTSRMIMESAATIAEMQLFTNGIWEQQIGREEMDRKYRQRVDAILGGDYGIPVRGLLKILGMELSDYALVLPTTALLCFLALNPPVPPFVMFPPQKNGSWKWADIYPPIRFSGFCHAVRDIGLIESCSNHDEIDEYIKSIVAQSGIPTCLDLEYPKFEFRENTPDFSKPSQEYPRDLHAPIHDYIFWAQSKLASFRNHSLPFLVNFGQCMHGPLAQEYAREILVTDDIYVPYSRCPLHWTSEGKVGFSCPVNFGHWLLRSAAFNNGLFDLVVGVGKYDLSGFPDEIVNSNFHEVVRDSMRRNLMEIKNLQQ